MIIIVRCVAVMFAFLRSVLNYETLIKSRLLESPQLLHRKHLQCCFWKSSFSEIFHYTKFLCILPKKMCINFYCLFYFDGVALQAYCYDIRNLAIHFRTVQNRIRYLWTSFHAWFGILIVFPNSFLTSNTFSIYFSIFFSYTDFQANFNFLFSYHFKEVLSNAIRI